MKLYLDSNVLLDVLLVRERYYENAHTILQRIESSYVSGYTSSTVVTDIYYLVRKQFNPKTANNAVKLMLNLLEINSTDREVLTNAVNSKFTDFEDAVQNYAAESAFCDIIITRNVKDYKPSKLKVMAPKEYLKKYS